MFTRMTFSFVKINMQVSQPKKNKKKTLIRRSKILGEEDVLMFLFI